MPASVQEMTGVHIISCDSMSKKKVEGVILETWGETIEDQDTPRQERVWATILWDHAKNGEDTSQGMLAGSDGPDARSERWH